MNGRHWRWKIELPLNDLAVRSGYRRTFLRITDVEMNIVLSVLSPVLKLVYPKIKIYALLSSKRQEYLNSRLIIQNEINE